MDKRFLETLACPRCEERPPLIEREGVLVCPLCGHEYRTKDGIPILLPSDDDVTE